MTEGRSTGWLGIAHLMKPAQVAERLNCSTWTVAKLRREGHLPAVRLGNAWRYDPADVVAYIDAGRTTGDDPPEPPLHWDDEA
jgi:excisionase family DNA binding protein